MDITRDSIMFVSKIISFCFFDGEGIFIYLSIYSFILIFFNFSVNFISSSLRSTKILTHPLLNPSKT